MAGTPEEHPFAPYVRTLGKGKKGSRSLSQQEAESAFGMILDGAVRPEQLGAFLMLLRVKEESPEEIAGFVQAVQARLHAPATTRVDLDWSTYAGKRRHLPWYLLSALALAGDGVRVLMHGARGHTAGRLYVEDLLGGLGLQAAHSWEQAGAQLDQRGFSYVDISLLNPVLADIINLRPVLGLRSPVHTLCRLLNPLQATCRVDGVFHPAYAPMHQRAARLLGQNQSVTVRGDGGEAEIKPDADCTLQWVRDGEYLDEVWPRRFEQRLVKESTLDVDNLRRLWQGELADPYGEAAVVETLAVCMKLLGRAKSTEDARTQARGLWEARNRQAVTPLR